MKRLQKMISCLLAGLTVFSCVSCNANTESESSSKNPTAPTVTVDGEIEFWSAPNTEKIMQDQYEMYSEIKGEDVIEISAVKNEYENAQLIMTAIEKVESYDVSISELKQENGATIAAENVTVYNQKYLEVSRITTGQDVPTGWYPDALIEFPRAKKAKENYIEKGKNQGLWITVYVPEDAAAGLYTAEVTVTYGNSVHKTPMQVRVADYVLSEEMHQQSCFLTSWHYENGELNDTWEIYKKYRDELLNYRLSAEFHSHPKSADFDFFVEEACEFMRNPKKPMVHLPFSAGPEGYDKAKMLEYLYAFIARSVEDNYDYLAQCYGNFNTMIDEPQETDTVEVALVHKINDNWILMRQELVEALKNDAEFMASEIAEKVLYSVETLQHVIVGDGSQPSLLDVEGTWCPSVDCYVGDTERYESQLYNWWYTFLWPKPPYPSYHIEDGLASARVMGWMQADYNVVGNLYWATNWWVGDDGSIYGVEDYYSMFNPNGSANGDGWLFYPGAKYGIEGPIPTIRLMAIRDGLEEYEMLYDLANRYEELSQACGTEYDFYEYLSNYTKYLYSRGKVLTTADNFIVARQALLNLCEIAKGDSAFALDFDAKTNAYTVAAKDGIVVAKSGETATAVDTFTWNEQTYKIYKVTCADNKAEKITATVDGKTVALNIAFVGEISTYTHSDISLDWFATQSGTISEATYEDKLLYKVALNNMVINKTQAVNFVNTGILDKIDETVGELAFDIYSESEVGLSVKFKYKNKAVLYEVATADLQVGKNEISIGGLYAYDWNAFGGIEYITFSFGSKGDKARTVYFGDIRLATVNF